MNLPVLFAYLATLCGPIIDFVDKFFPGLDAQYHQMLGQGLSPVVAFIVVVLAVIGSRYLHGTTSPLFVKKTELPPKK